jgi:hypothetical protein
MATAIKAIPTLKGHEAHVFMHNAENAEHKFKGFDNIKNNPKFIKAQKILRKAGMS